MSSGGTARWVAILSCVALTAWAAPNRQQAASHFQRGVELFEANDFSKALTEFRAAYDAAPSFEVLWNIGLCEKKLGRYADAVATLEAYLKQGGTKIPADRRAAVADQLKEVRALTAPLTVHATGAPATVFLDSESIGITPMENVLVPLGKHAVRVERDGFEPVTVSREFVSGQPAEVDVELKPRAVATAPAPAPVASPAPLVEEQPAPVAPRRPFPTLGVFGLSLGAAAIGGGVAFGIAGRKVSSEISQLYETGGTWDDTWVAKERWGDTARTLCPVSIAVGLGLAAAGGVFLAVSLSSPADAPKVTGVFVAPTEGGAFAAVGGAF
jgi:hypothetical protein